MSEPLKPPKQPCGSCPYRKDVPAGIWAQDEYEKLPQYDGEMWEQSPAIFMCHQRDGCLCGGWLATHGAGDLLAMRLAACRERVDPAVWDYQPGVEVFSSGAEAAAHGISGIENVSPEAQAKITGLIKARKKRDREKRSGR